MVGHFPQLECTYEVGKMRSTTSKTHPSDSLPPPPPKKKKIEKEKENATPATVVNHDSAKTK